VGSEDGEAVVDAFTDWPEADTLIEAGDTKASVRAAGVRVDLRVVVPKEFGSALQYFTGSKEIQRCRPEYRHRCRPEDERVRDVRRRRPGRGEADADQRAGERIGGDTEASMYEPLDMVWVPPELRENRGEIQAALDDDLPDLIKEGDVRGDLHTHGVVRRSEHYR